MLAIPSQYGAGVACFVPVPALGPQLRARLMWTCSQAGRPIERSARRPSISHDSPNCDHVIGGPQLPLFAPAYSRVGLGGP